MVYAIEENFMEDVDRKLKRVMNKCKRNGNDFIYRRVGEEMRENEKRDDSGKMVKEYHKFILIEVEGTAKVGNYECVAVLEVHDSGNIIRRINYDGEIPERFRHTGNYCEHCNSSRQRRELCIVRNVETNEFLQVGTSCLVEYTCGMNAELVVAWRDGLTELETLDGYIDNTMRGETYYSVDEVLGYTQEVVEKMGYFNSSNALSTKQIVIELIVRGFMRQTLSEKIMNVNKMLKQHHFEVEFGRDDFCKPETWETVRKIIEYYKTVEDRSEFASNVKVILCDGYVTLKNIGFLCYLPQGYAKAMEREVERAKRVKLDSQSTYFGNIGKRYKGESVYEVKRITAVDTEFGAMYIYKIVLQNGAVLVWKTSKFLCDNEMTDAKKATFTVKNHSDYNNCQQTEVTRMVFAK